MMKVGELRNTQDAAVLFEAIFSYVDTAAVNASESCVTKNGNINRRDEDGMALIHYAACHGDTQLIYQLKQLGADINILDDGTPPWKPVHYAIFHRQHDAEQLLIELGAQAPLPILKHGIVEKRRIEHSRTPLSDALGIKGITDKHMHGATAIQPKRFVVDRRGDLVGSADAIKPIPTR